VSGQLHALAALLMLKSPRYSLYRRLGGPYKQYARYGDKEARRCTVSRFAVTNKQAAIIYLGSSTCMKMNFPSKSKGIVGYGVVAAVNMKYIILYCCGTVTSIVVVTGI
jgi:hypothetical protein